MSSSSREKDSSSGSAATPSSSSGSKEHATWGGGAELVKEKCVWRLHGDTPMTESPWRRTPLPHGRTKRGRAPSSVFKHTALQSDGSNGGVLLLLGLRHLAPYLQVQGGEPLEPAEHRAPVRRLLRACCPSGRYRCRHPQGERRYEGQRRAGDAAHLQRPQAGQAGCEDLREASGQGCGTLKPQRT